MQREFELNILKKRLFKKQSSLLLAISGGIDSVVLTHLLKNAGYDVSLAHCNFKLRGKESDADEKFCRDLAKKLQLKISVKEFDVKAYCKKNKVSTQMAARELRYDWFAGLKKNEGFDVIVTAHHANDVVETVLINLLRGTGIKGLRGITEKNENVVRPLLQFTKEEITKYAKKEKIKFRLDKSNLKDDYDRNFLRLNVIPQLKKLNKNIESTFNKNTDIFKEEALIVNDYLQQKASQLTETKDGMVCINKNNLKVEKYPRSILHFIIKPYGFTETQQQNILNNILNNGEKGKIFISASHKLVIERNDLLIGKDHKKEESEIEIGSFEELKKQSGFKLSVEKKFVIPKKNELVIDESKLIFPLKLRTKRTGDKFKPFGMKGFKLLSDFLKDEKLSNPAREKIKLLVNGNGQIIWVLGLRSDDRYKHESGAGSFLKIKYND